MQPVCRWSIYTLSQHLPHDSQQEHVKMMLLAGLGDAVAWSISASICLAGCMHRREMAGPISVIRLSDSIWVQFWDFAPTDSTCMPDRAAMLKTTQALTSYKHQIEHLLWVPYATLCMLLRTRTSLVYVYTPNNNAAVSISSWQHVQLHVGLPAPIH